MAAVAAYNSSILVTSPPSVSLSNIAMTDSGDHQHYPISDATKRYLDRSVAVVVQTSPDGTTWTTVSSSTYVLQYVNATVIFNTPNASGTQVRLQSGNYYPYSTLGTASSAEYNGKVDLVDTTVFNTTGTHSFTPCLMTGTIKLTGWWLNETMINNLIGRLLLVVSFVLPSGNRYEGFCYMSDNDLKAQIKSAIAEDLTFQLTDQFIVV